MGWSRWSYVLVAGLGVALASCDAIMDLTTPTEPTSASPAPTPLATPAVTAPVVVMLLVGLAILPSMSRFTNSETSGMMNLLGVLKSTTLPADNPMRRPEVRTAADGSPRRSALSFS